MTEIRYCNKKLCVQTAWMEVPLPSLLIETKRKKELFYSLVENIVSESISQAAKYNKLFHKTEIIWYNLKQGSDVFHLAG